MEDSSRLWSLLDMLKVYAHQYLQLGMAIESMSMNLYMAETGPEDSRALSEDERADIRKELTRLVEICTSLDLRIAKAGLERAVKDLPQTQRELHLLVGTVFDELKGQLFLFVPAHRAKYHEQDTRYKAASLPNFPRALSELVHAGNCIAVGEYTAAVFHCMRAIEIALTAAYTCLGLQLPTDTRSWGNYCKGIREEIEGRKKASPTWSELEIFRDLLISFVNVKDSWRNMSLHVDASYAEPDAERIYAATTILIEKISFRMNEEGLPLA